MYTAEEELGMETGRQVSSPSLGHLKTCRDSYLDTSPTLTNFPGGPADKESTYSAEFLGLIPGLRRSHGEWDSYQLQYSVLNNSMDCCLWARKESDIIEQLPLK